MRKQKIKIFIENDEPSFYWLMYQTEYGAHLTFENGKIAMRHNHNGSVYGIGSDFDLDVAVGAMVADY